MHKHPSFVRLGLVVLALITFLYAYGATWITQPVVASDQPYQTYSPLAGPEYPNDTELRLHVTDIDLLGMTTFPTGYAFDDTVVGGLSGLLYTSGRDSYSAISDDRSETNPARFYTLSIDLNDGVLSEGDVTFNGYVTLESDAGEPFVENSIDPEGIVFANGSRYFVSSEGNTSAEPPVDPSIREFSFVGSQTAELPLPEKYLPDADGTWGARNNLAFESLAVSPNQRYLYTAVENALVQDGAVSTLEHGSPARILQYDLATGTPVHEYVYWVEAIPQAPIPADGFADNGLVDIQPLDNNGSFLVMERSFAVGVGNTIRLYQIQTQGAFDVLGIDSLQEAEVDINTIAVRKELLLDLAELGIQPDNVEGMTFGPLLADGRQSLILVSDNNFNEAQSTQFIALGLTFEATALVGANVETARLVNSDPTDLPEGVTAGAASDSAIWIHPTDSARSLVFGALEDGGLGIFGFDGSLLAAIPPETYGAERYANVDILYDFDINGASRDLIVATDGANDTLVIFAFEPVERTIENVTSDEMSESIFGIDDGIQTAFGLATYRDPTDDGAYVFVSQNGGAQVAQLALAVDDAGGITATTVRTLTLPANEDNGTAQGLAVDQQLGYLYVLAPGGTQILKYRASAAAGDDAVPMRMIQNNALKAGMAGLAIYYGANGDGYLITALPDDSSFALFERSGDNRYIDTFAVDQANGTISVEVTNVAIGSQYPTGLLIVQDSSGVASAVGEGVTQQATSFKFVPWENVVGALTQPLLVDSESYQPR